MIYSKVSFILIVLIFLPVFGSFDDQWKQFKIDYGKNYNSDDEKHAFEVFKNNLQEIKDHNSLYEKGLVSYKKGVTKFADLTGEEFTQKYQLHQETLNKYNYPFNVSSNSIEYLNWKEKGAVTKVKDQGLCGACWIFSAVGVVEGYYFKKNNKLITLSEQNLIDCFKKETCEGGYPPYVLTYLMESNTNGINLDADYPHKGMKSDCRFDKSRKVKIDFHNYTVGSYEEDEIKQILKNYGPIGIAIAANGNWRLYESGVWFEPLCSDIANHAILLVGYGTENGRDYWLLKNSYGKEWGMNGYIKVARNVNNNYCGIESFIMYIDN